MEVTEPQPHPDPSLGFLSADDKPLIPSLADVDRVVAELAGFFDPESDQGAMTGVIVVKSTAMAILGREGSDAEVDAWVEAWRARIPELPAMKHTVAMLDALVGLSRTGDGAYLMGLDPALRPLVEGFVRRFRDEGGVLPDPKESRRRG